MTKSRGPYIVKCAGIEIRRETEREAQRLAWLQEKRHGSPAQIYLAENIARQIVAKAAKA